MKLNLFMCFFFFENPLKDFPPYSPILLTLWIIIYKQTQRQVVCFFLVNFSSTFPINLYNSNKKMSTADKKNIYANMTKWRYSQLIFTEKNNVY